MDIFDYIVLASAIANIFLGFLIFKKGNNQLIKTTYGFLSLNILFWAIAKVIYRNALTIELTIIWDRILYIIPFFIVNTVLYFSYVFPEGKKPKNKFLIPIMVSTCMIMTIITLFSDKIIANVLIRPGEEKFMVFGKLYFLYSIYLFGFFFWSWVISFKKIRESIGLVKTQASIVFWGIFLSSATSLITNVIMLRMGNFKLVWAGHILILIMVAFIAYAIIAHRLMDIKLVMRRYSVYLASLSVILIVVVIIKYFIELYYINYSVWLDLFILLSSISVYPAVKDYFYRVANKHFFSSLYDSSEVIATLSEKLRSTLEAEKIYEYIYQTLGNAFHVKAFGILTYEKNNIYVIRYNQGFKVGSQAEFSGDEALHRMFVEQNKAIITEEVKRLELFEKNQLIELFLKLKVEILAPLNVKNKTIGLIALGAKESGDMYNEEDFKVLEVVGAQAAIALENALLYKETKNFSVKLEKEVEKATHDLRKANTQLKKLDAAKSEFISIASHQLRTPLTVIKGYISMMLEGNFGVLTKPETESLEKVFISNERLIQLVENLLNISRIESGRLQFDFKQVDLNEMVESVIEELSGNAKKKGLILQYKASIKPIPKIKIDEEKIRQVVMNLIDNAIKYTKQGSVTVKLEQTGKKISFSVADSGMGVRPEDMVNLFKKFSRGTGTSLIHTEGTGLGLYVARMMIAAHKGKIWAESDGVGKGSRFCFELPTK